MKNKIKLPGLIAFFMIIGLSFFSCNVDGGGSGGGGGGIGGGIGIGGGGIGGGTTYTVDGQTITIQNTNGKLTITGLDAYNGKYVHLNTGGTEVPYTGPQGESGSQFIAPWFSAHANFLASGSTFQDFTVAKISNGQAVLKVWTRNSLTPPIVFGAYSGNNTDVTFVAHIIEPLYVLSNGTLTSSFGYQVVGRVKVNFANGIGTGAFTQMFPGQ